MMKIWRTKLRNKIIKLFVVDYTWYCSCPFLITQNIIHDFLYIHQRFAFIKLDQQLRRVKKTNLLFLKASRRTYRIENRLFYHFFFQHEYYDEITLELLNLDLIENDIVDMFDREVC